MANVKLGSIVADIRGSVGDETYSRNQGGNIVRARAGPTGEATQEQLDCRAAMKALQLAWSADLSDQQRADWRAYAHQFPRRDCWGRPRLTNGFCRFIKANFQRRRQTSATRFKNAPPRPPLHPPIFNADAWDNDGMRIYFPIVNYDPPFTDLRLFVFTGKPMSAGVNYYSQPYRFNEHNEYLADAWWHDPWWLTSHWDIVTGNKLWIRMIAQNDDSGEISEPGYAIVTVI